MVPEVDPVRRDPAAVRSPGPGADQWPVQAADAIERLVDSVRDKTTGPILTIARAIVFGLFAAFAGIAALVLLAAALVRVVDVYLPSAVFGEQHTWAAHGLVGLIFVLIGAFCWTKALAAPHRA